MAVRQPGERIAGKYRVEGRLGSGGMATVYHCTDPDLGVPVAIKVLHDHLMQDNPEIVERFRREAKLMARLSHPTPHPNLVAVRHVIIRSDLMAIIMELIEHGRGLDEHLEASGPLPEDEAVALMTGVLAGMQYTHESGVLHRDIKPSNVLLARGPDGGWLPKVTDFGIAKSMGESEIGAGMSKLTQDASMFGSPAYMAPELFDSATAASPQSDIYALGVMFYELLTGSVPFPVDSIPSHVMRVSTQPAPSPRSLRPELSDDVERALAVALAKEPEDRFATSRQFLDAITGEGGFAGTGDAPDVIAGAYRVESRIGRGPNAVVYSCVDEGLGVPVALKVLSADDATTRQRFLQLTQAQAPLHQGRAHPNIIAIRHTIADDAEYALVLERVEGLPLDRFVTEARPDLPTVLQLFTSAADAIAYAHAQGILHHNLKPTNFLVAWKASASAVARKRPRAKISDFGMNRLTGASLMDVARHTRSVTFLAPEVRQGADPTPASDVFSLAVLMLLALRGEVPDEPLALQVPANIAPQLHGALTDALSSEPSERPDIGELRDILSSVYSEITGEDTSGLMDLGAFMLPDAGEDTRSSLGLVIGAIVAALLVAAAIFLVIQIQGGDEAEATAPEGEEAEATSPAEPADVVSDTGAAAAAPPEVTEPPPPKGPTPEEQQEAGRAIAVYLNEERPQDKCLSKLKRRERKKVAKANEGELKLIVTLSLDAEGTLTEAALSEGSSEYIPEVLEACLFENLRALDGYPAAGFPISVDKPFIWYF